MLWNLLNLSVALGCLYVDYLIYKYVKVEAEESKHSNVLLKKLLHSRKRSTKKAIIKELLTPETAA